MPPMAHTPRYGMHGVYMEPELYSAARSILVTLSVSYPVLCTKKVAWYQKGIFFSFLVV